MGTNSHITRGVLMSRLKVGDALDPATVPPQKVARSQFVDSLPQFTVIRAYATAIPVGAAEDITAGMDAWYGLRRVRVIEGAGQEFSLTGAAMELLPTDSAGGALTGYTSPKAWGDTRGITAAIVVGKNLPITPNAWTSGPAYVPGIDFGNVAPHARSLKNDADTAPVYYVKSGFPTGTFRDTAPNKPPLRWSFAPHVARFTYGETFDIALVVRRAQVHALGSAGELACLIDVACTVGLSRSAADFQR